MRRVLCSLLATVSLGACVSTQTATGAGGTAASSSATVPTDGFETYVTQHNGFTRIRRSDTQAGDAAILSQFEDANPASPAGFRSLLDTQTGGIENRVNAEIIIEEGMFDRIERVLRLTSDVEAFNPAQVAAAGGEIVLSGSDYSLVRLGDGAYDYGHQSNNGSLYLALNFDNETAAIRIINRQLYFHTPQSAPMDHHVVDLLGENLPFNTETGMFGGEISGEVTELFIRMGTATIPVTGTLLGHVGGAARDDLVAGGVFEATGSEMVMGRQLDVRVDGVFAASN